MRNAEVAQQVEQRTENPRVPSPILGLGTSSSGSSSVVECLLAKEEVASSNLVFRSNNSWRRCQVVKAGVCKTPIQRFESARRLHLSQICRGGGIGRRRGLKILRPQKACGFETLPRHHDPSEIPVSNTTSISINFKSWPLNKYKVPGLHYFRALSLDQVCHTHTSYCINY